MFDGQQLATVPGGVCRHREGGADKETSRAAGLSPAATSQGRRAQEHSVKERVYCPRRAEPHTEVCQLPHSVSLRSLFMLNVSLNYCTVRTDPGKCWNLKVAFSRPGKSGNQA